MNRPKEPMTKIFFAKDGASRNGSEVAAEEQEPPNPYLNAKLHWNSCIEKFSRDVHTWKIISLICLLIALGAIAGIISIGSKSRFIPYVVEVDKLGEAVTAGRAQIAAKADARVIKAELAAFVANARLVTPDMALQRRAIFTVYALLKAKDPATIKMNEWYNGIKDKDPFTRATKETVDVEIASVLPISDAAWQVDWRETERDRDGTVLGTPMHMRAVLDVYIAAQENASEEQLRQNPLGVYVKDFNWQRTD
jgi:type IV secretion system protein TrbF